MICRSQSHLILIESSVPISFVLSCVLPVPCSDGSQVVLDAIDPSRSETANASPPIFKIYIGLVSILFFTPPEILTSPPLSLQIMPSLIIAKKKHHLYLLAHKISRATNSFVSDELTKTLFYAAPVSSTTSC